MRRYTPVHTLKLACARGRPQPATQHFQCIASPLSTSAHIDARAPTLAHDDVPGVLLGPDAAGPVLPNDARLPGVLRCLNTDVTYNIPSSHLPTAAALLLYATRYCFSLTLSLLALTRLLYLLYSGLVPDASICAVNNCPLLLCCTYGGITSSSCWTFAFRDISSPKPKFIKFKRKTLLLFVHSRRWYYNRVMFCVHIDANPLCTPLHDAVAHVRC